MGPAGERSSVLGCDSEQILDHTVGARTPELPLSERSCRIADVGKCAAAAGARRPSPSVSVMRNEPGPGGRHAGEPYRRAAFEDPGSGPWRTDVIAFVGLPLLLLAFSWIAEAAFRGGGGDRWNGLLVLCVAALLVVPAALRWRRLRTEASTRILGLLYIVLGVVALAGVVLGLT